MKSGPDDEPHTTTPRLLLRPNEAAEALGIGQRKLWELTDLGLIRSVKIGRCVRYPIAELEAYVQSLHR